VGQLVTPLKGSWSSHLHQNYRDTHRNKSQKLFFWLLVIMGVLLIYTYGHDVGDKAIQHISNLIKDSTRDSDCVARFGGEEFVVMLPQTSPECALMLAETIRQKIENSPLEIKQLILDITVSGGVSEYKVGEQGLDAILKRSDVAMYQAKGEGRNKICRA
jgi:diguanylate cyclase (GGDEF)-like protein